LQQVGAKGFANAQPVDPRHFPVVIDRTGRNALVKAGHVWVLHRRLVLRGFGVLLALVLAFGMWESRNVIATAGTNVYRFVQGEFAAVGFGIDAIEISGQTLTADADIITLLTIGTGNSTLTFDAQMAQARLEWLRAVESATVRKVYPNKVIVSIVERVPVVRWRIGDTTWLIDERGKKIGTDIASYTDLPLVIGEGADTAAVAMVRLLDRYPDLKDNLAALSRIGDRRWDLIYRNSLRVQLPETGVAQALSRLEMYQADYQLLDRDVTLIDLRVPGLVALKPGEIAAEQLAVANGKKPTKKPAPVATPAAATAAPGTVMTVVPVTRTQ
jgi:cell division protein FtsQ